MCFTLASGKGARHEIIALGTRKSRRGGKEGVFESDSKGEGIVFEA